MLLPSDTAATFHHAYLPSQRMKNAPHACPITGPAPETLLAMITSRTRMTSPAITVDPGASVLGALSLFDFSLIDAAQTLGCSYPAALMRVMVPALGPAFLTSGMFAFLASMDNYPISIFFTDAWTKTLPIQMLQYVEENPDPTIAAISAGLVLLAILALVVGDRLVGLRKLADF